MFRTIIFSVTEMLNLEKMNMQYQNSPNVNTTADHPLSSHGRFNRISYIGWYGLLNIIFYSAIVALSLSLGIFDLTRLSFNDSSLQVFSSLIGFGYLIISLLYIYFNFCFVIRRLHDTNKSGWFCLLLFVPIVNILLALYLLFARGCASSNRFGHPRPSNFLEKICAWFIIIFTVFSLLVTGSLVSYMWQANEITTPTSVIQKGTAYF